MAGEDAALELPILPFEDALRVDGLAALLAATNQEV